MLSWKLIIITLFVGFLFGCSDAEQNISDYQTKITYYEKIRSDKLTLLAAAQESQGKIKSLLWDDREIDFLQDEISQLDDTIKDLHELVALKQAGKNSSSPVRKIFSSGWFYIVLAGIVLVLILVSFSEGGMFGDDPGGLLLLLLIIAVAIYFFG